MGNRQSYAKFPKNLFESNEIISIFCPPLFLQTAYTKFQEGRPRNISVRLY